MKKLLLALCLAFLSIGAYAADQPKASENVANLLELKSATTSPLEVAKMFGCYNATSSCGVVWEICGNAPIEIHMLMWEAIDAACGTSIWYIEIYY